MRDRPCALDDRRGPLPGLPRERPEPRDLLPALAAAAEPFELGDVRPKQPGASVAGASLIAAFPFWTSSRWRTSNDGANDSTRVVRFPSARRSGSQCQAAKSATCVSPASCTTTLHCSRAKPAQRHSPRLERSRSDRDRRLWPGRDWPARANRRRSHSTDRHSAAPREIAPPCTRPVARRSPAPGPCA